MKKILVIALHKLGDNLQVTPVFRSLKQAFPESSVSVLTEKAFKFPFENNPFIDHIRFFDRSRCAGGAIRTLPQARAEKQGDLDLLAEAGLDLIVNRQSSFEGAAIASAIGAREIRGLRMREDGVAVCDDPWTRLLFAGCQERHVNPFNFVDYGINVAGGLAGERRLGLFPDPGQSEEILKRHSLIHGCRIIAFQPGSNSPMRRWSTASFAQLAEKLLSGGKEERIVILGSPAEAALAAEIMQNTNPCFHSRMADLSREVPLAALPGILKRCRVLVTNDTGPMHVAAAVGCPVIALYFGESFVNETGPYGPGHIVVHAQLPCLPCTYVTKCERKYACREIVSPAHIEELIRFSADETKQPDPARFSGVAAHFSGRGPLNEEIRFRPLLRPPAAPEDILRVVFRAAFKKHLSRIDADLRKLAGEINADYAGAGECLNRMTDLNVNLINRYSRSEAETGLLREIIAGLFIQLRALLA